MTKTPALAQDGDFSDTRAIPDIRTRSNGAKAMNWDAVRVEIVMYLPPLRPQGKYSPFFSSQEKAQPLPAAEKARMGLADANSTKTLGRRSQRYAIQSHVQIE
jgi:hypothetical protein